MNLAYLRVAEIQGESATATSFRCALEVEKIHVIEALISLLRAGCGYALYAAHFTGVSSHDIHMNVWLGMRRRGGSVHCG